ncbi:MAG: DUF2461 domain-containing protein [Candidatus Cyclobacteriaceae bacterium M3_2C_046]
MDTTRILDFIAGLKQNNHKDWMDAHREEYLAAKAEFEKLINFLIPQLQQFDESIHGVLAKDCIFRINRDIRFSKDKSPYKTNFGAFMAEGGRKTWKAGYYLHLEPGDESMIAGGIYMPPGEVLKKIRQEVDYNPAELKKIVSQEKFRQNFEEIQGEKLKTAPKGYPADHPNIEFLKLKSYTVLHKVPDRVVKSAEFPDKVVEVFSVMHPFNEYLNVAVS